MTARKYKLHNGKKGAALAVRVTPRAKINQVVEILDDGTIRIRLKASANIEQINLMLIDFLSDILGMPKSKIEVVAGHKGRDKLISVLDINADTVHQKIVDTLS